MYCGKAHTISTFTKRTITDELALSSRMLSLTHRLVTHSQNLRQNRNKWHGPEADRGRSKKRPVHEQGPIYVRGECRDRGLPRRRGLVSGADTTERVG